MVALFFRQSKAESSNDAEVVSNDVIPKFSEETSLNAMAKLAKRQASDDGEEKKLYGVVKKKVSHKSKDKMHKK